MITLNYRDARPIYEQVCDGLRRLIVSGAIADGDKLRAMGVSEEDIQALCREGEAK